MSYTKKICSCLLACMLCYGDAKSQKPLHDKRYSIYFFPFALADYFAGCSYRFGTELKVYNNIAFALDGGGYLPLRTDLFAKDIISGYVIRTAIKVYLNKTKITTGRQIALSCSFKELTYKYDDSIVLNGNAPFRKDYTIYRRVFTVSIGYGDVLEGHGTGKVLTEWFAGVGVRFINSTSSLTAAEEDGRLTGENHGDIIGDAIRATGVYAMPNLEAGFRFRYRFK